MPLTENESIWPSCGATRSLASGPGPGPWRGEARDGPKKALVDVKFDQTCFAPAPVLPKILMPQATQSCPDSRNPLARAVSLLPIRSTIPGGWAGGAWRGWAAALTAASDGPLHASAEAGARRAREMAAIASGAAQTLGFRGALLCVSGVLAVSTIVLVAANRGGRHVQGT